MFLDIWIGSKLMPYIEKIIQIALPLGGGIVIFLYCELWRANPRRANHYIKSVCQSLLDERNIE